jgi:hypothetical protein
MGTGSHFRGSGGGGGGGVNRPESGVDQPQSSAEFKDRIELYLCSSCGFRGLIQGEIYLYI